MSNVMGLLESVEPRFLTDYVKKCISLILS